MKHLFVRIFNSTKRCFFYELESLSQEFIFNMKCRRLSKNSIANYKRLLRYLFEYLKEKYNVTQLEQVKPNHIKRFLLLKQEQGRKPQILTTD